MSAFGLLFGRARKQLASRGLLASIRAACRGVFYKLRGRPVPNRLRPEAGSHPFDVRYGTDTTGVTFGDALFDLQAPADTLDPVQRWVTGYYGTAPSVFEAALDRLALDWSRFTFVDIGCGKGRAVLLALRHPFREVVGIELSPELAVVAEQNLASFNAPWRLPAVSARVLNGDATSLDLPAGALLLFLFNPFGGPIMKRFLAHVQACAAAETRDLYLLYAHPLLAEEVAATPGFTQLWEEVFPFSAEEAAADRFGETFERVVVYRVHITAS